MQATQRIITQCKTALTQQADVLVGRETERDTIFQFVKSNVAGKTSGALYITGNPGTGKTATIANVLQEQQFQKVEINCLEKASNIMLETFTRLHPKTKTSSLKVAQVMQRIRSTLCQSRTSMYVPLEIVNRFSRIIVYDEIDQLNNNQLSEIFSWPSQEDCKLILIGISNDVDLFRRIDLDPVPKIVAFNAYSKDQLTAIIEHRLNSLPHKIFEPNAIKFISAKSQLGDLRQAVKMCDEVLRQKSLALFYKDEDEEEEDQLISSTEKSEENEEPAEIPKVTIKDLLPIYKTIYCSNVPTIQQLPIQQQLALLAMSLTAKDNQCHFEECEKKYIQICKENSIDPSTSALLTISNLLCANGLVSFLQKTRGSSKLAQLPQVTKSSKNVVVQLSVQIHELGEAFESNSFMKRILDEYKQ